MLCLLLVGRRKKKERERERGERSQGKSGGQTHLAGLLGKIFMAIWCN
jgi:hypothetical protein